jgi:LytS/YehU family sensor histidine kinase
LQALRPHGARIAITLLPLLLVLLHTLGVLPMALLQRLDDTLYDTRLRATMPAMREGTVNGVRSLGQEISVIEPYLEILKVRMEERLETQVDVPEGLRSAEFPPMMVQGLVENAIKHGLEPKPEGGRLTVQAEVAHGKLVVTVTDTGVGFGQANTAGTGTGLDNIRERLRLLYGQEARLDIRSPSHGGTQTIITLPYKAHAAPAAHSGMETPVGAQAPGASA